MPLALKSGQNDSTCEESRRVFGALLVFNKYLVILFISSKTNEALLSFSMEFILFCLRQVEVLRQVVT